MRTASPYPAYRADPADCSSCMRVFTIQMGFVAVLAATPAHSPAASAFAVPVTASRSARKVLEDS